MGEHEVHRLSHREDLRRLLVGHAHTVGVLELLHERVQVERVGLQILLEARVLGDRERLDVEFVRQMGLDQREHLLARARRHRPDGSDAIQAVSGMDEHRVVGGEVELLIVFAAG